MWAKIAKFFGADRVVDSGMKIVDKLAGTDFTSKEKADWVLKYVELTKHQSPARRVLAFGLCGFYLLCGLTWLVNMILGEYLDLQAALDIAKASKEFMQDTLANPVNLIVGFYFFTHIVKK